MFSRLVLYFLDAFHASSTKNSKNLVFFQKYLLTFGFSFWPYFSLNVLSINMYLLRPALHNLSWTSEPLAMPSSIKIITRAEWMARQPVEVEPLKTPVDTVLIMYTGAADHMSEMEVLRMLPGLQQVCIEQDRRLDIPYKYVWLCMPSM